MKRRRFLSTVPAAASVAALGSAWSRPVRAQAAEPTVLRIATLAPSGSSWMRILTAWGNTIKQRSGGRLEIRFFSGGAAGDERDVIRKMRVGQVDGAVMTSVGLGQIVRPVLVLQAPGLIRTYDQMTTVRRQLASSFDHEFESAGFKLLAWGDGGEFRLFANRPIVRPSDMRQSRFWAWRDDPIFSEILSTVGAQPVALGLPEVYPALQTNRIDAFPASALAAISFQWFNKATHMSKTGLGIIVGATMVTKAKWDALPRDVQQIVTEASAQMEAGLQASIRQDDARAYQTLKQRGIQEMDAGQHDQEWEEVSRHVRSQLTGRLYPAELVRRVEQIVGAR